MARPEPGAGWGRGSFILPVAPWALISGAGDVLHNVTGLFPFAFTLVASSWPLL